VAGDLSKSVGMYFVSEGVSTKLTNEAEGVACREEGRRLRLRVRTLEQLAVLPERPRPTMFVEGEVRELARRRRAAAGTGARINADMVEGTIAVAGVVAIVVGDYKRRCRLRSCKNRASTLMTESGEIGERLQQLWGLERS
jgi:hypothetical protein